MAENMNRHDLNTESSNEFKGKTGVRRVLNAFNYSRAGIKFAWEEQGFRQLVYINTVLVALSFYFKFGSATQSILILGSALTLMVELLNTAIEASVDHTSLKQHPLAKRAKDTASAAQTVALVTLFILWAAALWRYFG